MKALLVKIFCIILVGILCAGYGYAEESLTPLTIRLNWVTNVEFAGILLAHDRGWYKEAGIDLTIKGWESGVAVVEEVATGKADIGIGEGNEIINARAQGIPVKAITVQFQKTPFCLLSKKQAGITSVSQLAGKKIGFNTPASKLLVEVMLASANLTLEDVQLVEIGWELQPLISNEIDVYPGYMNNEPLVMQAQGYEVNVMPAFRHGYDFYGEVIFVTDAMLNEQKEVLEQFINVTLRGWRETFNNPEAVAKRIVETYYPDGTVDHQTESLKVFQMLATIGIQEDLIGYMNTDTWQKGIEILHKAGQIEKTFPASEVFTSEFLLKK